MLGVAFWVNDREGHAAEARAVRRCLLEKTYKDEPMPEDHRSGLPKTARVIGELSLIVVGVLIALAADALWQDRQDRGRAMTYLATLRGDMITADSALTATLTRYDARIDRDRRVLDWLEGGTRPDSGLVGPFYNPGFPVLRTEALEALVQTGDVSFLNEDLRLAVVSAHATLGRLGTIGGILYTERREIRSDFVREWQRQLPNQAVSPHVDAADVARSPDLVATYRLVMDNTAENRAILLSYSRTIARLLAALDGG